MRVNLSIPFGEYTGQNYVTKVCFRNDLLDWMIDNILVHPSYRNYWMKWKLEYCIRMISKHKKLWGAVISSSVSWSIYLFSNLGPISWLILLSSSDSCYNAFSTISKMNHVRWHHSLTVNFLKWAKSFSISSMLLLSVFLHMVISIFCKDDNI